MTPRTDIICLVHNQLSVTKGFVDHLFKNTDKDSFRLIFIDNASTDGTSRYLQDGAKDGKWLLVEPGVNLGIIKGRNLGATFVEADYFLNIDNDQYPGPGWLESLHKLMESGFDIVGCEAWSLYPPSTKGNVVIGSQVLDRSYYPYRRSEKKSDSFTYIGCGGMLIKRSVYEKIGLFDERFSPAYFEDPDFNFRALQAGYKTGWQYSCSIKHLAHQTMNRQSLFKKNDQFVKSLKLFREKWHPYYPTPIIMDAKR